MKKILSLLVMLTAFSSLSLFAEDAAPAAAAPIGFTIGSELAMESNFTSFGFGHWVDYYKSTGMIDFEGYVQVNPYFSPLGAGALYIEGNAFLNLSLAPGIALIPGISSQGTYSLGSTGTSFAYALEPSVKLDANVFYIKAAVPLAIMSPVGVSTYLEPGIKLGDFKLKIRGDISYSPFAFTKLKWYAEKGIDAFVVYAYGVLTGFSTTISYSQYLGISFAF